MAEEVLVKEVLTAEMIQAGEELTNVLDSIKLELIAVLWLYISESNRWKMVLSSPKVDLSGPRKVYSQVQAALSKYPAGIGITLDQITVQGPKTPLIRSLKKALRVPKAGISNLRLSGIRVDDTFIEDAFIYRLLLN